MITPGDTVSLSTFKTAVLSIGSFSESEINVLALHLKATSLAKGKLLLAEGTVCQSVYFLQSGSLRRYRITDAGDDITLNLYVESDWALDYRSLTAQQPSTSVIEAFEDCSVLELSIYNLHELMKLSDSFFQIARVFQYGVEQQENSNYILSPKERYLQLLSKKPLVLQRFPLKYIASYLNMTPETLSRVRRSIASSRSI